MAFNENNYHYKTKFTKCFAFSSTVASPVSFFMALDTFTGSFSVASKLSLFIFSPSFIFAQRCVTREGLVSTECTRTQHALSVKIDRKKFDRQLRGVPENEKLVRKKDNAGPLRYKTRFHTPIL